MNTTSFRLHEALPTLPGVRVRAVIDTAALVQNWQTLLARVKATSPQTEAIAVVKADAYGHGIRPVAEALTRAGCRSFAVACPEEAVALRGILRELPPSTASDRPHEDATADEPDILILGYTAPEHAPLLATHRITATLLSDDHARALAAAARRHGVTVRVHAALDTGMNRIGYPAHNDREIEATTRALLALVADTAPALTIDGLFTHFARADEDYEAEMTVSDSLTMTQYARYRRVLDGLVAGGFRPRVCHVCNSAAAVRFPAALPAGCLDMVRLGINLYGYGVPLSPAPSPANPSSLHATGDGSPALCPVLRLETAVSHVHDLAVGESVGYGGTYTADTPRTLVTLPVGYADGWLRAFSGASVTLHTAVGDFQAPVVGRICMDQCMLDITGLPADARRTVYVGTPVTLFGDTSPSLEALATRAHTITYELLCLITARVPRVVTCLPAPSEPSAPDGQP